MIANKYDLKELRAFPRSWVDPVSERTFCKTGLQRASVSMLEEVGWYTIIDNKPMNGSNDTLTKDTLVFTGTSIEQNYIVTPTSTLDEAKTNKHSEVWTYAESLIDAQAQNITGSRNPLERVRQADRSQQRLMKVARGGTLSPRQLNQEKWYYAYLNWAEAIRDSADLSCDAVDLLTTPENVIAYDPSTDVVWDVFVAP